MTETILEIKNLKKSYGKNEVLKDISLRDRKSTRLNSSHSRASRMPSSA